jgi:hypothetical protein
VPLAYPATRNETASQIEALIRDAASYGKPACTTCQQITVPKTISVTCMKLVTEQETVQYPVTRFQPSVQLQNVSYYEFQPEIVIHEEPYTV